MKTPSPNQLALLLPVTILIHQIEEYFGQFPLWYSNLLNANLSNQDFILINGVGLFIFTFLSLSYFFYKNNLILVALGTLVFVNGMAHLILCIFTFSYSPGTVSGVILFIPSGIVIFNKIMPQLGWAEKIIAVSMGIFILVIAGTIALNI